MNVMNVILVGPSGSGKSAIMDAFCARHQDAAVAKSITTRKPRAGENESNYRFVSKEEFLNTPVFESTEYQGNLYGTPADAFDGPGIHLKAMDFRGALTAKRKIAAQLVFVHRPYENLKRAVEARALSEWEKQRRLTSVRRENEQALRACDCVLDNSGTIEEAVEELERILDRRWELPVHAVKNITHEILDNLLERREGAWWLTEEPERGDRIPPEKVADILDRSLQYKDVPSYARDCIQELVKMMFFDADPDPISGFLEAVTREYFPPTLRAEADRILFELYQLNELPIYFELPVEHYMDQKYPVNVVLDAGDANYDFAVNCIAPAWEGEDESINDASGVLWLAKQQGYSKTETEKFLWSSEGDSDAEETGFLSDLRSELANTTTATNAVTFLVELSLHELCELYEAMKNPASDLLVHIGRNAMCGLVDFWDGAGGPLDMSLEKDVFVPIQNVFAALPDCSCSVGPIQYGVDSIYGLVEAAWKGSATLEKRRNSEWGPYTSVTVSNSFRVKDAPAFETFETLMKRVETLSNTDSGSGSVFVDKETFPDGEIRCSFAIDGRILGIVPVDAEDDLEIEDCQDEFYSPLQEFYSALQKIVADDDAIIICESGHEKLRYVTGCATIITSASVEVMDLQQMADRRAEELIAAKRGGKKED